jgi:hypothetical protein
MAHVHYQRLNVKISMISPSLLPLANGSFTLATFVSETIGDIDTRQSRDCTCFGRLGRPDTDRIVSIYVTLPKVDKASK